jgi:uncharacterized protein (DUF952 family)
MAVIFHITTKEEWHAAIDRGYYTTASLKDEGFIHCCHHEQIEGVLTRYFEGKENLLRLEIETDKLTSPFYYEWSPSTADTFPHIYGVINLDAVIKIHYIN